MHVHSLCIQLLQYFSTTSFFYDNFDKIFLISSNRLNFTIDFMQRVGRMPEYIHRFPYRLTIKLSIFIVEFVLKVMNARMNDILLPQYSCQMFIYFIKI